MDLDSDRDVGFEVGRRHSSSSSRESSPVAKRPRRSLSPPSDSGDLVVPVVHNEDAETPTPENAPLIRQPVGFSWTPSTVANLNTYPATVPSQPVVPYFLPGQAPPKPKPSRPRAPRQKKGVQYSDQTGKFKLSGPTLSSSPTSGSASVTLTPTGASVDTSSSSGAAPPPAASMLPAAGYTFGYPNGSINSVASVPPPVGAKRARKSSKKNTNGATNDSFGQQCARSHSGQPAPIDTSVIPRYNVPRGPSVGRPGRTPDLQRTYSASPSVPPIGTSVTAVSQASAQNDLRPLRMVTLLIEDLRSGVPDPQLAEIRVPLRIADDPEDGFWADAIDICNALQGGPSRIDGPAKVYTMRGRFRQFFMRVDQLDQFEVQSAHLGVSKERTLTVFVEAPLPQGQLPRPPAPPPDVRPTYNSGSEHEAMSPTATCCRPSYSLVTREDQIERLLKSSYAKAERGRRSPVSENGSYGHSQRTTSPNGRHKQPRRDRHAGSSQRLLTPPIPGRIADTQEEKDEAIANYIRSHIENHPGWMEYMESKAKPQRVSEVLKQYIFVEDRIRELIGLKTPAHWDGAPSCYVEKQHVWRVLKLDNKWGEDCQETMVLVGFYGKDGSRYEDSRVVDMINDTSPPKPNPMDKFLRFLRSVDERFTQDTFSGQFTLRPVQA